MCYPKKSNIIGVPPSPKLAALQCQLPRLDLEDVIELPYCFHAEGHDLLAGEKAVNREKGIPAHNQ